ncbi:MAG: hypothetical protein BMS9Abin02_0433 [Anaerolineae bacterium]|nr:MAG: hypothetical protein BMS9Abin02_0433 [Anaerolineae bacterium]
MMELQLIILPAVIVAISLWMIARIHKVRGQQQLFRLGILPIQRREGSDIKKTEVFLPQANREFLAEVQDLLVIGEDGFKQVNRYELHLLRVSPEQLHPLIEAFSLTD